MSSAWTNVVRFAMAALLGLAVCLIAWWPQSAVGSGGADLSPVAAAPTQNTPTPVHPTTTAPPPPPPSTAPPPSKPTPKPTHKPTPKPTHKATPKPTHKPTPRPTHHSSTSTSHAGSGGSTASPYVAPTHSSAPPTKAPTSAPTRTPTASPSPSAATQAAVLTGNPSPSETGAPDRGDQTTTGYDTYLSSSVPTQGASAPVWVVPGILLVLTSMLAVLGGVLGRSSRPVLAPVRVSDDDSRAADVR